MLWGRWEDPFCSLEPQIPADVIVVEKVRLLGAPEGVRAHLNARETPRQGTHDLETAAAGHKDDQCPGRARQWALARLGSPRGQSLPRTQGGRGDAQGSRAGQPVSQDGPLTCELGRTPPPGRPHWCCLRRS